MSGPKRPSSDRDHLSPEQRRKLSLVDSLSVHELVLLLQLRAHAVAALAAQTAVEQWKRDNPENDDERLGRFEREYQLALERKKHVHLRVEYCRLRVEVELLSQELNLARSKGDEALIKQLEKKFKAANKKLELSVKNLKN